MRPSLFKRQAWLLLLALIVSVGALSACGSDSTVTLPADGDLTDTDTDADKTDGDQDAVADGDKENAEAENEAAADGDSEVEAETEAEAEAEAETEAEAEPDNDTEPQGALGYRADTLVLFSPEMSLTYGAQTIDAKAQLNQQIANQIENGQLNMLLIPQSATPINFPNDIVLSYGQASGNNYTPNSDYNYTFTVNNDGDSIYKFKSATIPFIEIPINQADDQIFTLRDAVLSGIYEPDLSSIASGHLAGAVSETDADNFIVFNYAGRDITLKGLFTLLKLSPNYTFQDGSKGYSFIFNYTAQKVSVVQ